MLLSTDIIDVCNLPHQTHTHIHFDLFMAMIYFFVFQYYEYKESDDNAINDFAKIIDRLIFFILLMIILICIAVGY